MARIEAMAKYGQWHRNGDDDNDNDDDDYDDDGIQSKFEHSVVIMSSLTF